MDQSISLDEGLTQGKLHQMKPLNQRKLFLKITLWSTVGLSFLLLIVNKVLYSSIEEFENGNMAAAEGIQSFALVVFGVSILLGLSFILTAVSIPMWFYRAHDNLKVLKKKLNFTSGWAAGWFFVPFANIIYPAKVMKEIHNGTTVAYATKNRKLSLMPISALVTLWWAAYVISGIFSQISTNLIDENKIGSFGNNYSLSLIMYLVGLMLSLVSAVALNKLVNEITEKQEELRTGEKAFIPIAERELATS